MNILFVNKMRGYHGGAEQTIADLARGLGERGHVCNLAYATDGRDAVGFSVAFRQVIRCADLTGGAPASGGEPLTSIARETNADVLFIHNVSRLPDGIERIGSTSTVRMVHDVGLFCPTGLGYFRHGKCSCNCPAGWRCWLDLAFLARGSSKVIPVRFSSIGGKIREMRRNMALDALLTVSDYMGRRLIANGFDVEKIHVTNPVRHLPDITPTPTPAGNELLFVGTLQRGKGVDLLLHALTKVTEPFTLTIVGEGKSRYALERLRHALGLQDRVAFHGWVDSARLGAFYERATVVVIPTRAPESFCLIGPEAMHYGRPVVAFDVGGISSWLEDGHTGYLIPEQDVDTFAGALDRLLSDAALAREMGEKAARRVRERFLFTTYLDEVERTLSGDDRVFES